MSKTKNTVKTGISINSNLLARCDASIPLTNAQSRSEFISDAIEYYIASLNAQGSSKVLTPALESVIGSKITLSENGRPIEIKPYERNDATKLIEDFMLAANETIAQHFYWLELPFVYRSHDNPDTEKIQKVDQLIAQKMGFDSTFPVSGQTYSRKLDTKVVNVLAGIAASAHKFSNDIRLLQHLKEVEEPFEKNQIGSSAMAYKRNPMRSERIASLSKFVIAESLSPALVQATQWLERSLDDSANKRLAVPQAFMAVDAILEIGINVTDGLVVYENIINKHINEELPFMATETILMEAVKRGGDRQEPHEVIREYSMQAAKRVKQEGKDNNLLELILEDCDTFKMSREEILDIMDPKNFIGRAPEQVVEFVEEIVNPAINEYKEQIGIKIDLNV